MSHGTLSKLEIMLTKRIKGMVYCWKCAEGLGEMMQGRDNEELKSWFPDVFRVSDGRLQQKWGEMPRLFDEEEGEEEEEGKEG